MDESVYQAVTAVDLPDAGERERWFDLLDRTYREQAASGAPEWPVLSQKLADAAGDEGIPGSVVDGFVQHLEAQSSSPVDVVAQLSEASDQLPALYEQLMAQSAEDDGGGTGTEDGYDEQAWNAFLAENGPAWNGDEATWQQFREWFRYEADQQGLVEPADQFLEYVNGQDDKIGVFGQYGITIAAQEPVETVLDPEEFPLTYQLATLTTEDAVYAFLRERGIDMHAVLAYREAIAPATPTLA